MGRRAKGLRAKKQNAKKNRGTRENATMRDREGRGGRSKRLLLATETRVVSPTVYGGGVCIAPYVHVVFSSLFPLIPSSSAGFSSMDKKKCSPAISLSLSLSSLNLSFFFLPERGNDISVCSLRAGKQVAGVFFYGVPFFSPRDVRKDLTSVVFFCSSAGRSRWKIYTPLERDSSGIRGIVRSL